MNILIKIFQYKYLILICSLLFLITFLYLKNEQLEKSLSQTILQEKTIEQNFQAYSDSVKQKPDSTQIYHSFVKNLENEMTRFKQENNIKSINIAFLNNKIIILSDSINFLEKKVEAFEKNKGTDSVSYEIQIKEENEFTNVNGYAKVFPVKKTGLYKLKLVNKELQIENFLTFNPKDTSVICFSKINNSKQILSNTTISPELYKMLSQTKQNENFADKIKIGAGIYYNLNDNYFLQNFYSKYNFTYGNIVLLGEYNFKQTKLYYSINANIEFSLNDFLRK